MTNLLSNGTTKNITLSNYSITAVSSRLDALLLVLKSCKGTDCIQPWLVLHPQGNVNDLNDALSSEYDDFYEEQQSKVSFSECELGYIISAEGPQNAISYGAMTKQDGLHWSLWV